MRRFVTKWVSPLAVLATAAAFGCGGGEKGYNQPDGGGRNSGAGSRGNYDDGVRPNPSGGTPANPGTAPGGTVTPGGNTTTPGGTNNPGGGTNTNPKGNSNSDGR